MHRKFIALVLGTSIAITGFSAAPARADGDTARIFAGLALLAIIGAAIQDNNKRRHNVTRQYTTQPPRPLPQGVKRFNLPGHCLGAYNVNGGIRRLFGAKCLRNNYRHYGSLPYACQLGYTDGRNRNRTGYEPTCLRERGYRVARN